VILGHHMGEESLAAVLAGAGATVPAALLGVRARLSHLGRALRRRRGR
jgi:hypothetical protein